MRDNARGYNVTAYDKDYDEAYRQGFDRGYDEANRRDRAGSMSSDNARGRGRDRAGDMARGGRGGARGRDRGDYGYDMENHHNIPMDMNYDRGYDEGYERGYQDKAYEMLSPYGNSGMTVSGDGRQGVRGTGRYGIGGSRYYGRRDRGEEEMSLPYEEMEKWKHEIMNADGTQGYHFELPQVEQAMRSLGIQPKEYTVEELCMTANMLYSDYCKTFKNIIPKEKEAMYYTAMAKDFLEDKDASVKGSEKLMAYYYCIVKD